MPETTHISLTGSAVRVISCYHHFPMSIVVTLTFPADVTLYKDSHYVSVPVLYICFYLDRRGRSLQEELPAFSLPGRKMSRALCSTAVSNICNKHEWFLLVWLSVSDTSQCTCISSVFLVLRCVGRTQWFKYDTIVCICVTSCLFLRESCFSGVC